MDAAIQTVLLCAEEDDLDLVGLVHRARQRGLELQVVSGVDGSDEPMLHAMQRTNPGLFVLVRTDNLAATRARELKARFGDVKVSDQHLLALKLDLQRIDDTVEGIRRRLARINEGDAAEDQSGSMRRYPDSLDPMFTPIMDRSELLSADPEVTERHKLGRSGEEETTRSIQYYRPQTLEKAPARRFARVAVISTAVVALGAAGYVAYRSLAGSSSPTVEQTTADDPEAEPDFNASGVQVPAVEDKAPEPSPSKPQLKRRTIRRSGH